jgi:Zn-dependent protease with chaperone function
MDVTDIREGKTMGIGTSIFLIALGAILRFAVTASVSGIEIATVGTILLVVGIIGLLISLLYTTIWADRTRPVAADRTAAPPADREVVRERY